MAHLLKGNSAHFAIESQTVQVYERLSFRALGYFVIYLHGAVYGVRQEDATMLACSFDEVGRRLLRRGHHVVSFAAYPDAGEIARAVDDSIYGSEEIRLGNIPSPEINALVHAQRLMWAPDGDEAFDDGSYVLQFDVESRVRLIAYRRGEEKERGKIDESSIRELWLEADEFYAILQDWRDAFEMQWRISEKVPEQD